MVLSTPRRLNRESMQARGRGAGPLVPLAGPMDVAPPLPSERRRRDDRPPEPGRHPLGVWPARASSPSPPRPRTSWSSRRDPTIRSCCPLYEDPIPADTPIERNTTLRVYNWADYLWPRMFREFEDRYSSYGVTVELTTFNDISEGIQKMSSGQVAADVFFPDPSWISRLVIAGLLRPLTHELIPNLDEYWPEFKNPFYDGEWRYSVPYTIYTTGIAYRRDHISDDEVRSRANPYDILWDPAYQGKVTLYDDFRETIGMALLRNGVEDVNTDDPGSIATAKDDILEPHRPDERPAVRSTGSTRRCRRTSSGSAARGRATSWPPSSTTCRRGPRRRSSGFWYPEGGGGMIGNDTLVIPTSGENPRLAHEFVNFMLDKDVSYKNFVNFNGYQTPLTSINPRSLVPDVIPDNLAETVVRPKYFDDGHFLLALTPDANSLWNAAWDEIKAGG